MLSDTWDQHRHDGAYRRTLFGGMARLMLALARLPQPRIGSFIFNPDQCTVTLGHRPLTCVAMILESEEVRSKHSKETFASTDAFVADMLALHDDAFVKNPNAVFDEQDRRYYMATRLLVRALSGSFIEPHQRNGPFTLQMTDLHQSNIFVDEAWNITCLVDLEWICSLPTEMLTIPSWLTGLAVDELKGENLQHYERIRSEFLAIMRQEEVQSTGRNTIADLMQKTWESGGTWFWFSLSSVNAMIYLVRDHLAPLYSIQLSRETN